MTRSSRAMTVLVMCAGTSALAQTPFHLQEATIASIHAAFADGSVQFLSEKVGAESLRVFLTKAGGEVVNR